MRRSRFDELMEEMREDRRLAREEYARSHAESRRAELRAQEEHRRNQAAFADSQAVMREMVLELRDGRGILRDIQDGIRANTEGLLRVLDELRRRDGPSPAGA